MNLTIDCTDISCPEEFHRALANVLSFPAWYGNNLDSLYDQLSSITKETRLIISNWKALPPACCKFRLVLDEAEENNDVFNVVYQE